MIRNYFAWIATVLVLCCPYLGDAFLPLPSSVFHGKVSSTHQRLYARSSDNKGTSAYENRTITGVRNFQGFSVEDALSDYSELLNKIEPSDRESLKRELALVAISSYDIDAYQTKGATVAEDIMRKLEPLRPWKEPACHSDLNTRWTFVFTGVPTIGMKLITLLSRLSVKYPVIEFENVFLEISEQQTKAKAIVTFKVFGLSHEINVRTDLCRNETCTEGTLFIETFRGLYLDGVQLPTPESWHRSRDLAVTYLDEDMMIARTAGGEPHLLLRHSPCSVEDLECDIDETKTEFFENAEKRYGKALARKLVDRAFGTPDEEKYSSSISELIDSILKRSSGPHE